jgi:hypothetical protein
VLFTYVDDGIALLQRLLRRGRPAAAPATVATVAAAKPEGQA